MNIILDKLYSTRSIKMCDACFGFVHDFLTSPLHHDSPFHSHIHKKSLLRVAPRITRHFLRACGSFNQGDLFFTMPEKCSHENLFVASQQHDDYLWNRYLELYPNNRADLIFCIDELIDNGVVRKTRCHYQLAEIFIKAMFRQILQSVRLVHHEHSNKIKPIDPPSPGPVPSWKIQELKQKVLTPTKHLFTIQVPVNIDEDPLYW